MGYVVFCGGKGAKCLNSYSDSSPSANQAVPRRWAVDDVDVVDDADAVDEVDRNDAGSISRWSSQVNVPPICGSLLPPDFCLLPVVKQTPLDPNPHFRR